ncbi:MAG: aryl-sulfate sulfotransferase [Ilumatobacter sp.]|uniref:aryl-sulfate sulfotransferase n=1 Tax=Ilumatobacter sp. TaxID=1967498 RepID=UPI003C70A95F
MRTRNLASFVAIAVTLAACSSGGSDSASTEPSATSDGATPTTQESPASTDEVVTSEALEESTSENDEAPTTEPGDTDPEAGIDIAIEASPHISLAAAVTVTSEEPMFVQVSASGPDHEVEVPRTAEMATEHVIPLVGMRAESTYVISVTLSNGGDESLVLSDVGEFVTGSLPEYFADHELTIDAERAAPGYTIVEFDSLQTPEGAPSSQHLVAYDNDGEIVWYYTNTGGLGGVEPTPAGTFNMFYWPFGIREVDILGNVVGNWRPQERGVETGEVDDAFVVDSPDPDLVQRQGGEGALAGNEGDAPPVPMTNDWIDLVTVHHENWPMPNGNTLTLSTTTHELTPEQRSTFCPDDPNEFNAISDVAVEFTPDGQIVRTWDLWDAIDIDEHPGVEMCVTTGIFAGDGLRDWNHANSVTYDPDRDAVIISSRHTNQIVAFDHLDDEGPQTSVRWILGEGASIADGGANLPLDGEPTYYQHAVEVNNDGSLIVYDNGNFRPGTSPDDPDNPPFSRAVIYDVDDSSADRAEWSATQRWENIDTEDDGSLAYSTFISDADVLSNGNVLVTHGGIGTFPPTPENPLHILIREVVPDGASGGDVVWELKGVDGFVTYRAERIPSFYFGPEWAES